MNKISKLAALSILGAFLSAIPASAQASVTARVIVRPGTLSITGTAGSILNFNDTALFLNYAAAQTVTGSTFSAAPGITISDRRGTAANGWRVQVQASNFTGAAVPANTIAATNFSYDPSGGTGAITKVNGPADSAAPGEVGGGAATLSTARTVARATRGNGRGTYTYAPAPTRFSVSVPAGTPDDTYNSTVTFTVLAGP